MITDSMAMKLINFYQDKEINKKERKQVKIIVDSIIEQLCKHYFGVHPSGIINVRALINKEINKYETNDQKILIQLKKVLRNYDTAFSKDYTDYADTFKDFVEEDLKKLMLILLENGFLHSRDLGKTLWELIS